jgi:N6-L-threonylcarbamoyladenine synthase
VIVLGVESSCDDTAAAVVRFEAGRFAVLSNVVSSQLEVHRPYGGVVPELASRAHIANVVPVVERALGEAGAREPAALDGVAATRGPGLPGALLVGLQLAKALAYVARLPFVGVNHLEGHLCAPALEPEAEPLPERHLALLVSGGHTCLVLVEGFGRYRLLGASRDDAAGEAFDKVAKLLGLGYPGGPAIERLAEGGSDRALHFPRALARRGELDFSFSGLKTAVASHVRARGGAQAIAGAELADLCASFQRAVCDVLVRKACAALAREHAGALVAGGGVIANSAVRRALAEASAEHDFALRLPPLRLCTDNGAMIAAAGARRLAAGERSSLELGIAPRLPL